MGPFFNVFNSKSYRSISWHFCSTRNLIGSYLGTFYQLESSSGHFLGHSFHSKAHRRISWDFFFHCIQLKISSEHFLAHLFNSKSHQSISWNILSIQNLIGAFLGTFFKRYSTQNLIGEFLGTFVERLHPKIDHQYKCFTW